MADKTGRSLILEQLLADGIRYMFGNPGTVEEGFLDALGQYPELKYILTLQETIAVLTADGHARATQKPTVVQLHSTPGKGSMPRVRISSRYKLSFVAAMRSISAAGKSAPK